jgi:hypothetical protein
MKAQDKKLEILLEILRPSNFMFLKPLYDASPEAIAIHDIYHFSDKVTTRKTAIQVIRRLSLKYHLIEPSTVKKEGGFEIAYKITPYAMNLINMLLVVKEEM